LIASKHIGARRRFAQITAASPLLRHRPAATSCDQLRHMSKPRPKKILDALDALSGDDSSGSSSGSGSESEGGQAAHKQPVLPAAKKQKAGGGGISLEDLQAQGYTSGPSVLYMKPPEEEAQTNWAWCVLGVCARQPAAGRRVCVCGRSEGCCGRPTHARHLALRLCARRSDGKAQKGGEAAEESLEVRLCVRVLVHPCDALEGGACRDGSSLRPAATPPPPPLGPRASGLHAQERRQTNAAATSAAEEGARLALKAVEQAAKLRAEARAEQEALRKKGQGLSFNQKVAGAAHGGAAAPAGGLLWCGSLGCTQGFD
jgi:hypothetical protein